MSQKRVSIIAIGTELTNGQIVNRNASWISAQLARLGIQTTGHWTIPDDRPLIQRTLDFAAQGADLLFVTGGLGPTTDDFTREEIATWCGGLPLEWHEPSWQHLSERLQSRGLPVREIQRQQALFPKGATVLTNSQGTANGFLLEARGKTFVCLPGPPREIEAIWEDHLAHWLPTQFPDLDPWITRSWDTIGYPESTIAQITEEALRGADLEKGYRVHLPYVEVKVSFAKSRTREAQPWIDKLEAALAPFTALRDGTEITAEILARLPSDAPVVWIDEVSRGFLWHRLSSRAGARWKNSPMTWSSRPLPTGFGDLLLRLSPEGDGARATLQFRGRKRSAVFQAPYQTHLMRDRAQQYFAEQALLFWTQELTAL